MRIRALRDRILNWADQWVSYTVSWTGAGGGKLHSEDNVGRTQWPFRYEEERGQRDQGCAFFLNASLMFHMLFFNSKETMILNWNA